jgi:hypothetical protein
MSSPTDVGVPSAPPPHGSGDDDLKDKQIALHYGDVPIVELRRACILLTISVCIRKR